MNINIKLDKNFTTQFNKLSDEFGTDIARLNGFAEEQLSYTDFIDNFVDKETVADASIDGNANVGTKDVCSLENEMSKPHSKLLAFNKIYYEMNKKYGFKAANEWLRKEWDGHFYLHDAASASMKPYCFSGDTKFLTKQGIKRLDEMVGKDVMVLGKNRGWEPATVKHFGKSALKKLTVERYGVIKEIMVTGNHRWFVQTTEGEFVLSTDELVYGMTLPYNSSEEEHYEDDGWVVDSVVDTGIVDDVYCAVVEGTQSFTLEGNLLTHNCFAYDLENLVTKGLYFVNNFNAQPPKHLVTFTDFVGEFVSYTSNRSSGACGLPSFLVYSFYFWKKDVEDGYYTGSPERYRDQEFQRIIYKLNQPYLRVNQSAFTNFSIFDRPYFEAMFGGKEYPDGTFMIDYIDEFMEYQKAFMNVVSEVRSQNMMTFPVLTYSLLRQDGKFVDEDFAKWCCKHNMTWADSNFFISEDVTSLSNCCRLVSDVKDLGYFNSIGGSALEVGSVKVNTINLARIAYETKTPAEYLDQLSNEVVLCCQVLDVIRHIIQRNIEKGLLPNYTYELMHMKSQYSTIGIIGIYEVLQKFGMTQKDKLGYTRYTDEGIAFAQSILATINETKNVCAADKDYSINVEQIPAERAASILMQKDMFFYPKQAYELPLYGNQWIPLGVKTTIAEKVRLSAILDKACNGGSIAHVNIDAPFNNFDTAWNMLNYMADSGVPYFAFCTKISACDSNHGFYGDTCPVCGGKKTTTYQRIVGFLTPEKTYSKERKAEFNLRDWFDINGKGDLV